MKFRDGITDGIDCIHCGEFRDRSDLDRLLWCEACRVRARFRASRKARIAATVFALAVAAYVWGVVRPSDLVLGGWAATVVGAYWIGGRIAREVFYGIERSKDTPYRLEDPAD